MRRLLRSEGLGGVATRLIDQASGLVAPAGSRPVPVSRDDLGRAAEIVSSARGLPSPAPRGPGEAMRVAWVCAPPGAGSGGHTTMFRLVAALERAGHACVIYLHDRHGWSLDQHRETIRTWWPWLGAEVRDLAGGIEDAHAVFATSWETAYPVLASPARGVRLYLVQDFEPSFYPAGSEALLAAATYGFGFHGVTAGRWLAERLRRDYGMSADHFAFGRDPRYSLDPSVGGASARTGVCFYARPATPRRAYELGVIALDLLAQRQPQVDIHLFGEATSSVPFTATSHGVLSPELLNNLYNRCIAGLVLSATNVSLVPHEMLAAGCIPVVNDAEHNRIVLDNPEVAYAPATPFGLANALSALVERAPDEREAGAAAAAASVERASWDDAGEVVCRVVEERVRRAARESLSASA
jgi:O-antigen biosynthesis protein